MIRAMPLRSQLVLLQGAVMLVVILSAGIAAVLVQERQIRDQYLDRMIGVAQSVAQLPTVVEAFDDPDPSAVIQPIAELIRTSADVTYVVVTDVEGIRFSHPDPDRIGERASTEPTAATSGEVFVGTQTGTLGESWRVKVPVFGVDGEVVGQASVGMLESDLRADLLGSLGMLVGWLTGAAIGGLALSFALASIVRRRTYGLEPDEIKAMLETRDATLHGIREGILVVDEAGDVVLCNDAAARLLGGAAAVGQPFAEVLELDLDEAVSSQSQALVLAGERVLVAHADAVLVHGKAVGAVVILMDRTETDAALRELAGAQSIAEGLRAQRHEFANTLHTIGGLLELGEGAAALRLVRSAGDGGAISDASIAGIHDLELAALLLAKKARARELGVSLTVDASELVEAFAVDGADLVTITGNLVDNAIEASAPHGAVEVRLRGSGGGGSIEVADDGPGIAAEERSSIFDLGHTSKSSTGGRGYGLTLVQRVVRRLGGSIEVGGSALGGARIAVVVPVRVGAGRR
ncbi:sensor histidine kinase [Microbacterium sp. NPDC055683]